MDFFNGSTQSPQIQELIKNELTKFLDLLVHESDALSDRRPDMEKVKNSIPLFPLEITTNVARLIPKLGRRLRLLKQLNHLFLFFVVS